jgi:hypothetical protein
MLTVGWEPTPETIRKAREIMESIFRPQLEMAQIEAVVGTRPSDAVGDLGWLTLQHAADTIRAWWNHMLEHRNLSEIRRVPHQSKTKFISPQELHICIGEIEAHHSHSIWEAVYRSTYIRALQDRHGITTQTLLRVLKKYEPRLRKCMPGKLKVRLNDGQCQRRLQYVERWLKEEGPVPEGQRFGEIERLKRVIWIDQKIVYIVPKLEKVWCVPETCQEGQGNRRPMCSDLLHHSMNGTRIYYYAAVNWYTGPLLIKLCTGTRADGLGYDRKIMGYKVSACAPHPACTSLFPLYIPC